MAGPSARSQLYLLRLVHLADEKQDPNAQCAIADILYHGLPPQLQLKPVSDNDDTNGDEPNLPPMLEPSTLPNKPLALEYYVLAARAGHTEAAKKAAIHLYFGASDNANSTSPQGEANAEEVEIQKSRDRKLAAELLSLSAEHGDVEALKMLAEWSWQQGEEMENEWRRQQLLKRGRDSVRTADEGLENRSPDRPSSPSKRLKVTPVRPTNTSVLPRSAGPHEKTSPAGPLIFGPKTKAFSYWRRAANLGDNSATHAVSQCYLSGDGTITGDPSPARALAWQERAASRGDIPATVTVAMAYRQKVQELLWDSRKRAKVSILRGNANGTGAKSRDGGLVAEKATLKDSLFITTEDDVDRNWDDLMEEEENETINDDDQQDVSVREVWSRSLHYTQTAADVGDAASLRAIAEAHSPSNQLWSGWDFPKDIPTSVDYYLRAADAGDWSSFGAALHLIHNTWLEQNSKKARKKGNGTQAQKAKAHPNNGSAPVVDELVSMFNISEYHLRLMVSYLREEMNGQSQMQDEESAATAAANKKKERREKDLFGEIASLEDLFNLFDRLEREAETGFEEAPVPDTSSSSSSSSKKQKATEPAPTSGPVNVTPRKRKTRQKEIVGEKDTPSSSSKEGRGTETAASARPAHITPQKRNSSHKERFGEEDTPSSSSKKQKGTGTSASSGPVNVTPRRRKSHQKDKESLSIKKNEKSSSSKRNQVDHSSPLSSRSSPLESIAEVALTGVDAVAPSAETRVGDESVTAVADRPLSEVGLEASIAEITTKVALADTLVSFVVSDSSGCQELRPQPSSTSQDDDNAYSSAQVASEGDQVQVTETPDADASKMEIPVENVGNAEASRTEAERIPLHEESVGTNAFDNKGAETPSDAFASEMLTIENSGITLNTSESAHLHTLITNVEMISSTDGDVVLLRDEGIREEDAECVDSSTGPRISPDEADKQLEHQSRSISLVDMDEGENADSFAKDDRDNTDSSPQVANETHQVRVAENLDVDLFIVSKMKISDEDVGNEASTNEVEVVALLGDCSTMDAVLTTRKEGESEPSVAFDSDILTLETSEICVRAGDSTHLDTHMSDVEMVSSIDGVESILSGQVICEGDITECVEAPTGLRSSPNEGDKHLEYETRSTSLVAGDDSAGSFANAPDRSQEEQAKDTTIDTESVTPPKPAEDVAHGTASRATVEVLTSHEAIPATDVVELVDATRKEGADVLSVSPDSEMLLQNSKMRIDPSPDNMRDGDNEVGMIPSTEAVAAVLETEESRMESGVVQALSHDEKAEVQSA
ncbi:hypothetical protein HK102_013221 [Quaeritorhiza haematococci]|nr:hypothetical protein HK102_013221 [Quaeritorhiza haematococci]